MRPIETYAKDNEGESKKLRLRQKSKMGRGQHRRKKKMTRRKSTVPKHKQYIP